MKNPQGLKMVLSKICFVNLKEHTYAFLLTILTNTLPVKIFMVSSNLPVWALFIHQ